MSLMIAEAERRKEVSLHGVRCDIDRVLGRFGEVLDRRTWEEIVVAMFEKGSRAIELQCHREDRRQPPDEITPPVQVPPECRPDGKLYCGDGQQLLQQLPGRRRCFSDGCVCSFMISISEKLPPQFCEDVEIVSRDEQEQARPSGARLQERAIDVAIDIVLDRLRRLVMIEVCFAIIEE